MQTTELELETSLSEALGTACNAIGRKRLAQLLWPERSMESARRSLDDCLNPDRRDKFSIEQIDMIIGESRKYDSHAVMRYLARSYGYRDPQPVTPESERDRLQREFIRATQTMQQLSAQMERLGAS